MLITSCRDSDFHEPPADEPGIALAGEGMIVIGRELENPYTVANMREAYASLVSQGVLKSGLVIDVTHVYVRVLPSSEQELDSFKNHILGYRLQQDPELLEESITGHIYSYPLHHELIEGGTWFHDPSLPPGSITWQYTVVPAGFNMPPVKYEVIDELFLKCDYSLVTKSHGGIDHHAWHLIEAEALELAGDTLPGLKSRSRWYFRGRVTVFDHVFGRQIPLEGAKVRARRWFTTHTALTSPDGFFAMNRSFRRDANYSIIWERADWDIRSGDWGQAYFNGPKHTGPWYLDINPAMERSLGYATIHRALMRYYYSTDRLGLKPPYHAPFWRSRLKVGYFHRAQAGCGYVGWGIPYVNWVTLPHVRVFGKSCSDGWLNTNIIFGITINELAHISHWDLLRYYQWAVNIEVLPGVFADLWLNEDTRIIPESWSDFVEWGLTNLEYHSLGQRFNNATAINYNHGVGMLHGLGMQRWSSLDDKHYTPLFIDLVDDFNQRARIVDHRSHLRPNDNVSGFTFRVLEQNVLRYTLHGFDCLRDRLKLHKPAGVTDAQIDELIDFYANL